MTQRIFDGLIAYPVTPADADGRVGKAALSRVLAPLAEADGVGLLGSTGAGVYLGRAERRRAVAAARAALPDVPLVVGVGSLITREAMACARDAAAEGADGVLLQPVSYAPLTEREVEALVLDVAEAAGLPLCLYDNPTNTRFAFTPDLVERLAAHPLVVAIKTPATEDPTAMLARLRPRVPQGFSIGVSVDWQAAGGVAAGADAWHSVAAGFAPEAVRALYCAAREGREAAEGARLAPLLAFMQRHSGLRTAYAATRLAGLGETLPPRPLLPLGEEATADLSRLLER